ncbi:hypothetical protein HHJ39_09515 [Escherichia coli]|nr:hypothetical protein HHJ39_09515 [Escherichia coli]
MQRSAGTVVTQLLIIQYVARIVALSTPFGYYRKTDRLLCLLTLLLVLILVSVSGVSVFVLLQ